MNLGDLEFKPGDFDDPRFNPHTIANRILREKLAKAPRLAGGKGTDCKLGPFFWQIQDIPKKEDTHRARLVCIEEIEK